MMYLTHDVNFQYFYYNGIYYKIGTIVKLTKEYTDTYYYNDEPIWKLARFSQRVEENGKSRYVFWPYRAPSNNYSRCFSILENDLERAIDEIIEPIEIKLMPKEKKTDLESTEVVIGWAIYIIALLFSFIFKQWYLIWLWGSILFFAWRKNKLLE